MASIIVNGQEYNDGISDIVEITQAAYNALPDSKLTDGILYCISDSADGADGFPPLIYSTYEREVGVWTDGKPLYQKTVHISSLPDSSHIGQYVDYPHGIADIENIIDYEGLIRFSNGTSLKFVRLGFNINAFSPSASIDSYCNQTNIRIMCGSDRSSASADYTIWYTKTTDTAGSGKWNGQGGLAHHYSTNEQVIGTWLDKPLYEKTVNIPSLPNATQSTYAHGIVNYKEFVSVTGYAKNSTGTNFPLPFANAANANYAITLFIDNDNIKINTGTSDRSSFSGYVTLRYTKTTD